MATLIVVQQDKAADCPAWPPSPLWWARASVAPPARLAEAAGEAAAGSRDGIGEAAAPRGSQGP